MGKVTFPSFRQEQYTAFEMRQLVSALELRFQVLEMSNESLFDTGDTNDLDNRYSQLGHTHTESEITDLQNYLTNIESESIFDLSDVTGTPQQNWVLVWSDAQSAFVVQSPGAAAAVALNDLSDVSVPAPNDEDVLSWDQGSGQWVASAIASGGVNTLVDLLDTDLSGQLQYDLLFNADSSEWQPTGQAFQWFPGQYIQLGNEIAVNWYDSVASSTELLNFRSTFVGGTPTPDPDIGSVTLLVSAETADVNSGTFTADIGGVGWTFSGTPTSGVEQGHISDVSFKHGSRSVFVLGATGATFEGLVGPEANSTEAAVFFPIGLQDFTIEWWIDPSTENTELNPDGRWGNPKEIISSLNTQNPFGEAMHIEIAADGDLNFNTAISGGRDITFAQVPNGLGSLPTTWMNETWTHWAITRESDGEFRAWCNGVLQGTTGIGPYPSRSTLSLIQPTNTQTVNFGCAQRNAQVPNGQASAAYIDDVRITLGVARYTTAGGNFTPPGPLDGTIGDEGFIVGDPGYITQIDGTTTTITGAAQLDTTLNVDGISTLNNDTVLTTTLDDATGDEIAFALNYTTNKATSGADTGFQMTMTDTLSPGTSLFADYLLGAVTLFDWGIDGTFTQYDLSGADSVAWSHDGTDFNTDFTNTADWNVNLNDQQTVYFLDAVGGNIDCIGVGIDDTHYMGVGYTQSQGVMAPRFTNVDAVENRLTFDIITSNTGPRSMDWRENSGVVLNLDFVNDVFELRQGHDLALRDAGALIIYDSTDTDSAAFSHDDTDFNTVFTTTTDWNITGLAGFNVVNYNFDVDQTVGAGQDNFVLTYDDTGGLISLEVLPSNSSIPDAFFTINDNQADPPSEDSGIEVYRGGVEPDTRWYYDESIDAWMAGLPEFGGSVAVVAASGIATRVILQNDAGTLKLIPTNTGTVDISSMELLLSGGLIEMQERTSPGSVLTNHGKLWASDADIRPRPWWQDDAGLDYPLDIYGSTDAGRLDVNASTNTSATGIGEFRFNNSTRTSVTNIGIGTAPQGQKNRWAYYVEGTIAIGSYIRVVGAFQTDQFRWHLYRCTGAPTRTTNNTTVPVEHVSSGPSPVLNTDSVIVQLYSTEVMPVSPGTVNNAIPRWDDATRYWVEEDRIRVSTAGVFSVLDSGLTDSCDFSHDSTDFNQNFAATTDYNIDPGQNLTGQVKIFTDTHLVSGAELQIRDSTNNDNVTFAHDGTDLNITETNTTNITFPATGTLGLNMTDNTVLTPILQDNATEADAPTVSTNAVTLTYSNGPMFEVDMEPATATVAVTISGGPPSGTHGRIVAKFQQDGATAQTLTWAGGTFRWDGGTAHPMNSTLDGFSIFIFDTWDGGTTWYGSGADFS